MTPDEVSGLLRYAATLDRWLYQSSTEDGALMITGWSDMLGQVPLEVAREAARRHYAEPGARTLTPGDILGAHRDAVREESARQGKSTPTSEAWERRCSFHTICACSHTECWGGFLDEEVTVTNALGREYPAVKRCPVCVDGILMAEERGIARRPRPAARAGSRR